MLTTTTLAGKALGPEAAAARGVLFERVLDRVRAFFFGKGFRGEDLEDICQELFLRVGNALQEGKYDPERSFKGWLFTVARNLTVDVRRRHRRRPEVALDPQDEGNALGGAVRGDEKLAAVETAEAEAALFARLRAAFGRCPEKLDAVYFRYVERLPRADVALALGVSERTVTAWIAEATPIIRSLLAERTEP